MHWQIVTNAVARRLPLASSGISMTGRPIMRRQLLLFVAAFSLAAGVASADAGDRKDLQLFNDVAASVNHYTQFTIFDDVNVEVKDGIVTLSGNVTMPYKRNDIHERVANVDGVQQVRNNLKVLPVSTSDDQLRYRIARAIYDNPHFWNYAIGPNPPIHIVVEHGHVTLTGVVNNDTDRVIARSLAYQFPAMSVKNELKTNAEMRDLLETIK
jgi:hyperosmotically inducible protein